MRNKSLSFHLWLQELYQLFIFWYYFIYFIQYTSCTRVGRLKKFRSNSWKTKIIPIRKVEGRSNSLKAITPLKSLKNSSRSGKSKASWTNSSKTATSFREGFIWEKIGYSGERFQSGNEEWMYAKPTTPSKSSKTTMSFREDFISDKISF